MRGEEKSPPPFHAEKTGRWTKKSLYSFKGKIEGVIT